MIITLTGRMGSGKNTVLSMLPIPSDYKIIDADKLGHEFLNREYVIKRISVLFPEAINQGVVDRKILGELVFPNRIKELNAIMHPYLIEEIHSFLNANTIINSALPFELKLTGFSDVVIFVDVSDEKIIARLSSKFSKEHIEKRLSVQRSSDEYKKIADIVINNNGNLEDLKKEINKKCKALF